MNLRTENSSWWFKQILKPKDVPITCQQVEEVSVGVKAPRLKTDLPTSQNAPEKYRESEKEEEIRQKASRHPRVLQNEEEPSGRL